MWLLFAIASAFFAGITSILAKCGVKSTDSTVATAIRTVVVLLFSWSIVFATGVQGTIPTLDERSILFLILSGASTGISWICYFKALQLGDINKVVPVDKSSVVFAIVLSILIFNEKASIATIVGVVVISAGTLLMIERTPNQAKSRSWAWLPFALMSAVFAALTSVFGKIGIESIDSNLGTALRTIVVLVMAWGIVIVQGKGKSLKTINHQELIFICLSGIATGASWLCFFRALQEGPASLVVPIDKLSILVSIGFAAVVFKERLTKRAAFGLALIVAGTMIMLV